MGDSTTSLLFDLDGLRVVSVAEHDDPAAASSMKRRAGRTNVGSRNLDDSLHRCSTGSSSSESRAARPVLVTELLQLTGGQGCRLPGAHPRVVAAWTGASRWNEPLTTAGTCGADIDSASSVAATGSGSTATATPAPRAAAATTSGETDTDAG